MDNFEIHMEMALERCPRWNFWTPKTKVGTVSIGSLPRTKEILGPTKNLSNKKFWVSENSFVSKTVCV